MLARAGDTATRNATPSSWTRANSRNVSLLSVVRINVKPPKLFWSLLFVLLPSRLVTRRLSLPFLCVAGKVFLFYSLLGVGGGAKFIQLQKA